MKCSHKGDFIIILLIILTSNEKGKAFVLFSNENSFNKYPGVFSASKNTLQDLDIFLNMNNPENPKHKIVKKQMVISYGNQLLGRNENRLVDKEKTFSSDTSIKDNNVNIANDFNSWIIQKLYEHEVPIPNNDDCERFMRAPKEITEVDEEKLKELKEIAQNEFRLGRDLLLKKKVNIPDTGGDFSNEPSNEWIDASRDSNQKVPPEFTPKPKLTLKVYHLHCKRESKNQETENAVGKRQTWNRSIDIGRRAFHSVKADSPRVHPRSFLVRIKKKGESKSKHQEEKKKEIEKKEKDDEEEDEDSEEDEDDQDEEEEEEETEYEDTDEDSVSVTTKPDRKEAIKEFFKTAKEAVINRAKFDDGFVAGSFKSESGKESLIPSKNDKEESFQEKSKKVLIDANIKLDGAISHAIKSLLGYGKKDKENADKLVREKEMVENLNVKNTNNESQLKQVTEQPLENNQRNKRNFSFLRKKFKDGKCSEKGGIVSVDRLINAMSSEYDREELLQKLHHIKYKDSKLNRYDLLVK